MKSKLARWSLPIVGLALFLQVRPAVAAAPQLDGHVSGIELAPQSLLGAALFVFDYHGFVNGKFRKGWGWMAVTHEDLPTDLYASSDITGGFGEIYIGFRRFDVEVNEGTLTLVDDHGTAAFDDDFEVLLSADISNFFGQTAAHDFEGLLSHEPFPPTIIGDLMPN